MALSNKIVGILSIALLLALGVAGAAAAAGDIVPVENLEAELSSIETELSSLEQDIDGMLDDLVDPKITSVSIFFTADQVPGRVPVSVELKLDGKKLAARTFSETDRLVLVRGGTIEIFGGISDPVPHTLVVTGMLSSTDSGKYSAAAVKGAFKFEPRRASANFLEINLTTGAGTRDQELKLSARHWSREP